MATQYLDRKDNEIKREAWIELRQDQAYCSVKRYDNGSVRVEVEWYGKVDGAQNVFDAYKKVFAVRVHNYLEDGSMVKDALNGETWHRNEAEALKHYEEFLVEWTESHDNGGKFVEEGNTLKPINPDLPDSMIVLPGFDGGSAW